MLNRIPICGHFNFRGNGQFWCWWSTNAAVFTLLSTDDNPATDGSIAWLPTGATFTGNITVQHYTERHWWCRSIHFHHRYPMPRFLQFAGWLFYHRILAPLILARVVRTMVLLRDDTSNRGTLEQVITGVPASGVAPQQRCWFRLVTIHGWERYLLPLLGIWTGTINRGPINSRFRTQPHRQPGQPMMGGIDGHPLSIGHSMASQRFRLDEIPANIDL